MAEQDFAINARARRLLACNWVRAEGLDVGTTDGVVLVKGRLELEPGGHGTPDPDRLVRRLRAELAAIPGVVDVVMEIHRSHGEPGR